MAKGPHVTLTQRLARLGLADRESQLKNFNVKAGAQVLISSQDRKHAERIAHHKVKSASDLKRLLGVPDGAVGQDSPAPSQTGFVSTADGFPFLPFPAVPLKDLEMQAQLTSYLLRTPLPAKPTAAEKQLLDRLDAVILNANISVAIFLAADIHVEEGATLIVDNSIQTLFGNHIILEDGSTIRMDAPVSRIDCARMRFVHS